MPVQDPAATVKVLFEAAQITVSDDEFERFVKIYPELRAQADGLYMPELEPEEPALTFDPTAGLS
jgi:hypothetical protein